MKVLIADKFDEWGLGQLRSVCDEVAFEPDLKDEALAARIASFDPDLLLVRSTKVRAEMISAGATLKGIVRAGSGVDNIDIDAASANGVMVANCPGMNAAAVAELTLGLMISLDRKIPDNVADTRARRWNKKLYAGQSLGFSGRTIGIIGAGGIGTRVAHGALALGMHVLYYHLGRQRRLVDFSTCERAELGDLLKRSDVVTIHIPGGASTHHLIDAKRLATMKSSALLINTSRAGIVDEEALIDALKSGALRGAALDVFPNEPSPSDKDFDSPFADCPNLYGTHHIGASTAQAQRAVAEEAVRLVREFRNTGALPNCVNMRAPATNCMLVVRMKNQPGSLAHVFSVISNARINAEEMDHVIYGDGGAACAHIRLDRMPDSDVVEQLRTGHKNMIGVEVVRVD